MVHDEEYLETLTELQNQKDLAELLLIGLKKVQEVSTIEAAKHWAKFYLIKSEKFRNA